jgi:energy-coupling factor transporter ATP-binding protein EcfA2
MNTGITLNNVTFRYVKENAILQNISLQIKAGTFLSVIGSNGCGKSTFLQLLNGLIPHLKHGDLQGEITVDGVSTKKKSVAFFAKKVGMLFQNPDFSLFNLTVKEEIEFGLKNLKIANRHENIHAALEKVNLQGYEHRDPQTLSLGEKQKLCLACVLALDTEYIVLDEPVSMLDYKSSLEIYQILANLNEQGKTIIVVEHDTDFLWQYAQETLILDNGASVAFGETKQILRNEQLLHDLGLKIPSYTDK